MFKMNLLKYCQVPVCLVIGMVFTTTTTNSFMQKPVYV